MRTARRLLARCVAVTIVACASAWLDGHTGQPASPASSADAPITLTASAIHERPLKRGETHHYTIDLREGEGFRARLELYGVPVQVFITGADDKELVKLTGLGSVVRYGPEAIALIAPATGRFRVTIAQFQRYEWSGRYRLEVEAVRDPDEADRAYAAAARTLEAASDDLFRPTEDSGPRTIRRLEEARAIWQTRGDRRLEAQAEMAIGHVYKYHLYDNPTAVAHWTRAIELWREAGDDWGEAAGQLQLGKALNTMGDVAGANAASERARALHTAAGRRVDAGLALDELALRLIRLGEYQRALDLAIEARDLFREAGEPTGEALALTDIALVHMRLGEWELALERYRQVQQLVPNDPSLDQVVVTQSGWALYNLGEVDEARTLLERGLAITRERRYRLQEGNVLMNLTVLYTDQGDVAKGIEAGEAALAIFRGAGDIDGQAVVSAHLGRLYGRRGDAALARKTIETALALNPGANPRNDAGLHRALGEVERDAGQLEEARRQANEGLSLIESLRARLESQRTRQSMLAVAQPLYELSVDILMREHAANPAAGHDAAALEVAERARARSLLELLGEGRGRVDVRTTADPALLEQERALRTRLTLAAESLTQAQRARAAAVAAAAKPPASTPGASTPGTATSGAATPGTASPGTATPSTAASGTATSGTATSGAATSGTATSGTATSGTATSGTAASGTAASGAAASGAAASGTAASGAAASGTAASGTAASGAAASGTAASGTAASGTAASGTATSGTAASGTAASGTDRAAGERTATLNAAARSATERVTTIEREIADDMAALAQIEVNLRRASPHYADLTAPAPLSTAALQRDVLDADTQLIEVMLGQPSSYLWVLSPTTLTSYRLAPRDEIERAARLFYEAASAPPGAARSANADSRGPNADAVRGTSATGAGGARAEDRRGQAASDAGRGGATGREGTTAAAPSVATGRATVDTRSAGGTRADEAAPTAGAASPVTPEEFERRARVLSDLLLGPAAAALTAKRLVIVAPGMLQYVPFAALPIPTRAAASASAAAGAPAAGASAEPIGVARGAGEVVSAAAAFEPLIARYEVVTAPSASVVATLRRERAERTPAPKGIVILADPVFDAKDPRVERSRAQAAGAGAQARGRAATATRSPAAESAATDASSAAAPATTSSAASGSSPSAAAARQAAPASSPVASAASSAVSEPSSSPLAHAWRGARGGAVAGDAMTFGRLPFSRLEADAIVAAAPRGSAVKAVDFEASHAFATSRALADFRIVHFATHGVLHARQPDLSGVVLSLVDARGQPQDGFLRLHEIYNLHLNADLVVLSGCQTALGKAVRGEGLVGVTRGFMYAGSPRVVASLWQVDDLATSELMASFYRHLFGDTQEPAAALRAAQLELARSSRWRSPYFWAAFVLQGDWQARQALRAAR